MVGLFLALCEDEVQIELPELNFTAHIFIPFHVTSQKSNFNVILGQCFLWELGIHLNFETISLVGKNPRCP